MIICLAYILGLLLSIFPWGGFFILGFGVLAAISFRRVFLTLRRFFPYHIKSITQTITQGQKGVNAPLTLPHPRVWLIAGLVGLIASFYCQFRTPQPGSQDVSSFISSENNTNQAQLVVVRGEVVNTPRLTRSQRGQFWFQAKQLDEVKNDRGPAGLPRVVTGKLYVTVPILQATGLYPGQQITVTGMLYKPKPADNPGGFDFQKYLRQEGSFAGLIGKQVNLIDEDIPWGWWQIRQQIVRSQVRFLGVPEGPLVSAMVLGNKAVDLPYSIRDLFVNVGLAHALAASGFQTSLILAVVLQLTKSANKKVQVFCGALGLIIFLGLAGLQPSILRAVIMGFAALIGLALDRKVQQLRSLLLAATLLLLFNPVWIWDLGFQLSFLATLGLMVTATPITQRLDWLPPLFATLISVPLAATIWTLPLLLHIFSTVAIYSVPLNIIATPLISIISIGGMISGLVSLPLSDLGAHVASFLYYPAHILIKMAEFFDNLPGNSLNIGSISIWQMLIIYGLIVATCLLPWWQKRWWLAGLIATILAVIPIWYYTSNLLKITLLATNSEPVLVIQDRGQVTLINNGDPGTGRFTILPFLRQQGINHIDWVISTNFSADDNNSWSELINNLHIKNFLDYTSPQNNPVTTQALRELLQQEQTNYQSLSSGQSVNTGSVMASFNNDKLPILQLQVFGQNWLLIGSVKYQQIAQLAQDGKLLSPQVVWSPSESLEDLTTALKPQVAIAPTNKVNKNTSDLLQGKTKLFFTGRDGAIQWDPQQNFQAFIQVSENESSNL